MGELLRPMSEEQANFLAGINNGIEKLTPENEEDQVHEEGLRLAEQSINKRIAEGKRFQPNNIYELYLLTPEDMRAGKTIKEFIKEQNKPANKEQNLDQTLIMKMDENGNIVDSREMGEM